MHLGYTETDVHLLSALELSKFLHHCFIVQVGEAARYEFSFCFQAGILIQVVIIAKIVLVQQEIDLFAPLAAEMLIAEYNRRALAYISAVITFILYVCGVFDIFLFDKKSRRIRICSG